LSQHHLAKIENPAWRVAHEKRLGEICSHLTRFPAHLTLDQQGLFAIAYYHQNRSLYQSATAPQQTTSEGVSQ
jgi:CRISPR-associated protein Csd1